MVNIQTKIRRALKKNFEDWEEGGTNEWWMTFFGDIECKGEVKGGFVGIKMSENLKKNELQMRHGDKWTYFPFDSCQINTRGSKRYMTFSRKKSPETIELVIHKVDNED